MGTDFELAKRRYYHAALFERYQIVKSRGFQGSFKKWLQHIGVKK